MRRLQAFTGALAAGLISLQALAVPVIPGGAGFGIETPAGRGGTVYKVTNLAASGTGSLRACIDATGPRVCVFEVSGTIRLTADLAVRNDFITIAGQTAPSPGILIRGAALKIHASDVLVQHLRIRAGDDATGPAPANRDSLKIEGSSTKTVRNIVIDHCSFSWAIDETVSVWGPHDNVTFTNNIFAEPLNESIHPTDDGTGVEKHGFGVLLGSAAGSSVTMIGNLSAHQVERNPLSRASELVFVNNVVYDRGTMDLDIQAENSASSRNTVLNTANNAVHDRVLARAGARPADRDVVDRRIVSQVRNRNGQIINCVAANGTTRCAKNGGGWPTLAQNTRRLTLPANPNGMNANGYTNLESWLHGLDQQVAGIVQANAPAAPQGVTVN